VVKIANNKYMVSYDNSLLPKLKNKKINFSVEEFLKKEKATNLKLSTVNVAVQIAAAITSYARIHMHHLKNLEGNSCYYSDTYFIFLEKPLQANKVSQTQLSLCKLEKLTINCVFLAPKIY
jgi:hypothetical protein